MIDNEINLAERVDFIWVTTKGLHGRAHGSQINDGWHTSEVLEEDASGLERDLDGLLRRGLPVQDSLDVGGCKVTRNVVKTGLNS